VNNIKDAYPDRSKQSDKFNYQTYADKFKHSDKFNYQFAIQNIILEYL